MQMKKLISAAVASCLSTGTLLSTAALLPAAAADPVLTFEFRSEGKNEITIKAADIAARDITVPVKLFIPSNPGVNGINLKMQINDGQIDEKGLFGNYGLYMADCKPSSPFCFDSASKGDPEAASFAEVFTEEMMNLAWCYSADPTKLPDAAAEANTVSWDSSVSWAYQNAFADMELVIPKNTPAGDYTLDIRTDPFVNALTAESTKQAKQASKCTSNKESALQFRSTPLTIHVEGTAATDWTDTYKIADAGQYYIIGDVCGKPGETVPVPVYVFNDNGTAGFQAFFDIDKKLTLDSIEKGNAYRNNPTINTKIEYPNYIFAGGSATKAGDGKEVLKINVKIPEDAKTGDVFDVRFYHEGKDNQVLKVVDIDGEKLDAGFYDGSIAVVEEGKTALNRTSVTLSGADQYSNLTLFNSKGSVTWKSENPEVATVDENGFIKSVSFGTTKVTATSGEDSYVCTVVVGLLGDVNRNGEVSNDDAQTVLLHYVETKVAGKETGRFGEELYPIADVDANGEVDVVDAQFILKYYVNNTVSMKNMSWDEILHPNQNAQ